VINRPAIYWSRSRSKNSIELGDKRIQQTTGERNFTGSLKSSGKTARTNSKAGKLAK
jgi:hypothetical protein